MLKIGDFSKLSRVSVKTLRYYDEMGLINPVHVDAFTGYRYYSASQLPRLNRILALKDLGFSLEQIARILDEGLSLEQLRGMLRLKRAEIQQRVDEEQERLARVEARLSQIEMEAAMSNYDVVLKCVEPVRVASLRDIIPSYSQQSHLWGELGAYLGQRHVHPAGPCLTLYHDEGYKEKDVDVEVCEPVKANLPASDRVKVYELPGVPMMACVVHQGSFANVNEAYEALIRWAEHSGYHIVGPAREVYLREPQKQDDPDAVTEVQFPVQKIQ
jgi:effector-binding domain-containing protein